MIGAIMKKHYLEFMRNKISVGLVFIFPLFFLFIFHLAFGGAGFTETTTYEVAIINHDTGIPDNLAYPQLPSEWIENGVGQNLSDIVFDVHYEVNGTQGDPIFRETSLGGKSYSDSISDGDVTLIAVIPENFSMLVLNMINNGQNLGIPGFPTSLNESITVFGQENSFSFPIANSIFQSIVNGFLDAVRDGDRYSTGDIQVEFETVLPEGELDIFDFIAAGLFVFGTVLSASFFSSMILSDQENNVFNRVKLSLVKSYQYELAFIIFALLIMIIQAIFLFAVAYLVFDFQPAGSFIDAFFVLLLLSLANLGLIFTVGAFMSTPDTAGNAIGTASPIIGFASGAFFQMPNVVLAKDVMSFSSGSPDLLVWDIFPWTHATNALRAIFLFDQSFFDVIGDILIMTFMGIIWFSVGVILFTKRRFAKEE